MVNNASSEGTAQVTDPHNPHGLGDPNDRTLRKVEKDVCVPKIMRDKAKSTKCVEEVAAFTECCKDSNFIMVIKCRKENEKLKECLTRWYNDDGFRKICEEQYLDERSEFRRTGVRKLQKKRLEGALN